MTSSNGNLFRVTGPLCGEITGHRWIPLTKASEAELWFFFHLCLNKRLSKQSWGWWFETPSPSLWRHRNEDPYAKKTVSFRLIQPELWRHGMEAFFALLVLWEEQFSGHRIPLTKCQQCRILMFSLWVVWTSCWIHSRLAGDLKHPNAYVASL